MSEKIEASAERIEAAEVAAVDAAYSSLSGADYDEVDTAVRIALDAYRAALPTLSVVFDAAPGPRAPRFIEIEDENGRSLAHGDWHDRADGLVELRLPK